MLAVSYAKRVKKKKNRPPEGEPGAPCTILNWVAQLRSVINKLGTLVI
jgi:hypothetical protein